MRTRVGASVAGWLLLCTVGLGVVLMHHVGTPTSHPATAGHTTAMTSMEPAAASTMDVQAPHHDGSDPLLHLLHLCLAVLATVLGLGMVARALIGRTAAPRALRARRDRPGVRSDPSRAPPIWGRDVLHTVCVLRV
ncbi:MAG: hypothetical protein GEV04_10330 [Actinophytocola sp.]|nr:hypothetical protein [Actinophytocola sp.]